MVTARLSVQSLALSRRCSKIGGCNDRLCQAHCGMKVARREKLTHIGGGMSADLVNAQEGLCAHLLPRCLVPPGDGAYKNQQRRRLMYSQRVCSRSSRSQQCFLRLKV